MTVTAFHTLSSSGAGHFFSLVLVREVISHLLQKLDIGSEINCLSSFLEQALMLFGSFRQHEGAAGGNLHRSVGLKITIRLPQEAEVYLRAA